MYATLSLRFSSAERLVQSIDPYPVELVLSCVMTVLRTPQWKRRTERVWTSTAYLGNVA